MNAPARRALLATTVGLALTAALTGGGSRPAGPPPAGPATAAPTVSGGGPDPVAAGDGPSLAARMVCEPEAAQDIYAAVRVRPSGPPTSSWADHLFTCRYAYPAGTLVLSVKDLASAGDAAAYLTARRGGQPTTQVAGQEAVILPDGSVFVRKDFKVLQVDVRGLPERFGQPPYPRSVVAYNVAAVIIGCWREN